MTPLERGAAAIPFADNAIPNTVRSLQLIPYKLNALTCMTRRPMPDRSRFTPHRRVQSDICGWCWLAYAYNHSTPDSQGDITGASFT